MKNDETNHGCESVCFFLTSGKTFTFRNAKILTDNETAISISYIAMSDGLHKTATFYKANLAGVSIRVEPDAAP